MADWSMEELQDWDTKICEIGNALGLDWYPIKSGIKKYAPWARVWVLTGIQLNTRYVIIKK